MTGGAPATYIVGVMADEWHEIEEAATELGLTVTTLRRWCRAPGSDAFARRRGARTWEVNMTQLRAFQRARRGAGSSRIRFQGFNFLGQLPNPRLKDASGWRFAIGKDGAEPEVFSIWVGSELIQRLKADGLDIVDALLRAGERLAEDKMLRPDKRWLDDRSIELDLKDRVSLLSAAGRAPDFLLPSEATRALEEGVPILYELTARDSGWVGEYLTAADDAEFGDVVVDWSATSGRRMLSTIRLRKPIEGTKAERVARALEAYRQRCKRLGEVPGAWVRSVEARLPGQQ